MRIHSAFVLPARMLLIAQFYTPDMNGKGLGNKAEEIIKIMEQRRITIKSIKITCSSTLEGPQKRMEWAS